MAMRPQNDGSPDTTTLYAWLSRDKDGQEGVIVAPIGTAGMVPLCVASRRVADRLRPAAEFAARRRGFPAHLVVFHRGETLEEVQ